MVISRTPLRVSFAGGGSDLPSYAARKGGAVVSATIDASVYVVVNPRFEGGVRASYTKTEIVETAAELEHDLLRESFRSVGWLPDGVEVVTIADVPGRGSGLGASSAVTVGTLNALYAYRGVLKSARELASEACRIEIERLEKPVGRQDQYAAAYGGLQVIRFGDGSTTCQTIVLPPESLARLGRSLLLFWTGRQRQADQILERVNGSHDELLDRLHELALGLYDDLRRGDPDMIGEYLLEGWKAKRRLEGVTDPTIDEWIERGVAAGATGGKLLGAGGGGFLLFYAPEADARDAIRRALRELRELPVSLEPSGSRIVYVGP